jgi:hypothetical protein
MNAIIQEVMKNPRKLESPPGPEAAFPGAAVPGVQAGRRVPGVRDRD